jgi:ABC-type branched-subunit amino acid transport system ATPase component
MHSARFESSKAPLLSLHNVTSGYSSIPIVRDVSLNLTNGEILAVVGRNGVGKTTLVKTIAGIVRAIKGTIAFRGEEVTGRDSLAMARRGVGYVPQGRGIFSRLTVVENLRMGETVGENVRRNSDYDQVYEWFPRLKERRRQRAGTLSGGEQQMLAIGRVLIGKPELLLLDEPSEGIQPNIVDRVAEVIVEQNLKVGLSTLLVEQNIGLARRAAPRCLVMDKGAFVANLSSDELGDPEIASRYLAI